MKEWAGDKHIKIWDQVWREDVYATPDLRKIKAKKKADIFLNKFSERISENTTILDIGCGNGYVSEYILKETLANVLLELLKRHCVFQKQQGKVCFLLRKQVEELLREGVISITDALSDLIVIENYDTSSIVYVPADVILDIGKMVYEAGYIAVL